MYINNYIDSKGVTVSKVFSYYDFFQKEFKKNFQFYLDFLDKIYQIPIQISIANDIFDSLPDKDRQLLSFYRTLNDSAITSSIAGLRLFSSNIFSDTFSILRILAETLTIMSYGNKSRECKYEVYKAFVKLEIKSELKEKADWEFLKKAKKSFIADYPGMNDVFDFINSFGSHISNKKIISGNISNRQNVSIPSFFQNNYQNRSFLLGLSFLASILINITVQYPKNYSEYDGVPCNLIQEVNNLTPEFTNTIQPRLIQMISEKPDNDKI